MNLLEKYIIALTNLYGRVAKETVVEIYNQQNNEKTTIQEVEKYLSNPPEKFEEHFVFVERGEFLSEDLAIFEEEYHKLVYEQRDKPRYIPEKDKLLLYVDPYYSDISADYKKLFHYVQNEVFNGDYDKAAFICEDLLLTIQMGDGVKEAMTEFNKEGYHINNEEQFAEVVRLSSKLNNTTRLRENNGFTPSELSKWHMKQEVEAIKVPSRNDPCHCGSGKKYKRCCMQKDRMKNKL